MFQLRRELITQRKIELASLFLRTSWVWNFGSYMYMFPWVRWIFGCLMYCTRILIPLMCIMKINVPKLFNCSSQSPSTAFDDLSQNFNGYINHFYYTYFCFIFFAHPYMSLFCTVWSIQHAYFSHTHISQSLNFNETVPMFTSCMYTL